MLVTVRQIGIAGVGEQMQFMSKTGVMMDAIEQISTQPPRPTDDAKGRLGTTVPDLLKGIQQIVVVLARF